MHVFLDILVGALYDGIAEVEVLGLRICCGDFLDLRSRGIVRRRGDVDLLDAVGEAGPSGYIDPGYMPDEIPRSSAFMMVSIVLPCSR